MHLYKQQFDWLFMALAIWLVWRTFTPLSLIDPHTVAALAVREPVKTELSHRNDTIIVFFFVADKKYKQYWKMLWPPLMLNPRVLDLIWRRTTYFVQKNSYLTCRQWSKCEWPKVGDPFLAPNGKLRVTKCLISSLFTTWYGFFGKVQLVPFREL